MLSHCADRFYAATHAAHQSMAGDEPAAKGLRPLTLVQHRVCVPPLVRSQVRFSSPFLCGGNIYGHVN